MVVALLVLIVLILLFGAGVVKGWIANAATMGCSFIALCLAILWLGSFFGTNGVGYVLASIGGVLGLLAILSAILNHWPAWPTPTGSRATLDVSPPASEPIRPGERSAVDRVWGWFAHDIELRFTPEARAKAQSLYDEGNAHALDRFCREQSQRPQ